MFGVGGPLTICKHFCSAHCNPALTADLLKLELAIALTKVGDFICTCIQNGYGASFLCEVLCNSEMLFNFLILCLMKQPQLQ